MAYPFMKNGKWYAGYTDALGRPRKKVTPAKNKTQARLKAEELELEAWHIRNGLKTAPRKLVTVGQLCREYLEVQAPALASFDTIKQRVEDHIIPALGDLLVMDVEQEPQHIQRLLNKMAREGKEKEGAKEKIGYAEQTRQHVLNHISAIWSWGLAQTKYCQSNPAAKIENIDIPERNPEALELSLVAAVIACVPDRWRTLFAVAVYTGLRKGELLGLEVANVSLKERTILAARSHGRKTTKGGKFRSVPIPDELVPYLKVELGRVRSKYLFPGLDGERQSKHCNLPRTFRNAMKAAGVVVGFDHKCRREGCGFLERRADNAVGPCPKCGFALYPKPVPPKLSFKDLRSTCGTYMYSATGDLRFVQELLGHDDIKTTTKYQRRFASRMLTQANKLSFGLTPQSLPTAAPDAKEPGKTERIPQSSRALTATRGRGLEPLTSGVTGQEGNAGVGGVLLQVVGSVGESGSASLALVGSSERSLAVVTPQSLPAIRGLPSAGRVLKVEQVAEILQLHPNTVYLMLKDGRLPATRFGALVRVCEADLEAFIAGGGLKPPRPGGP